MKKIIFPIVFFLSIFSIYANNTFSQDINLEMFLMRKGIVVEILLSTKGSELPISIEIERKTTSNLSNYRKILTLNKESIEKLGHEGKIKIKDSYPESSQIDAFYRIKYRTKEGIMKTPPAVILEKTDANKSVKHGSNNKNPIVFELKEDYIPTYEEFGLTLNVRRQGINVLVALTGGKEVENREWHVERKTEVALGTFRRIKIIKGEGKIMTVAGEHIFLDKYAESRKLDSYYRVVLIDKDGKKVILPNVYLKGDEN